MSSLRACARCRARKMKCDKGDPCHSCSVIGVRCIQHIPDEQQRQPKQRVLISKEYESKIDGIETRLAAMEQMLQSTNDLLRQLISSTGSTSLAKGAQTPGPTPQSDEDHNNRTLAGDTSLLAHSRQARQMLEERIRSSPFISSDSAIASCLTTLRTTIQEQDIRQHARPSKDSTPFERPRQLPPRAIFKRLLIGARDSQALFFSIWTPFLSYEDLLALCLQVYDTEVTCSNAQKIIAYGAIHYMMVEQVATNSSMQNKQTLAWISDLMFNLEGALQEHRTCTVASYETILASVLGATHAIQSQDLATAWSFNCISSRLCQDLGWHRAAQHHHENEEAHKILFWIIYYVDKCLSLRLGRSSTIQDYDVTVELPSLEVNHAYQSWVKWLRVMIELADVHGKIYEKLYSPGSFLRSSEQRTKAVHDIVSKLQSVAEDNTALPAMTTYRQGYMSYLSKSNEVVVGCLLTLAYRALPGDSIDELCLEAARSTIRGHLQLVMLNKDSYEYVTWTLLNCPFTPFIVLFTNVIVTLSLTDLELLDQFVDSLDCLDVRSANSITKMRELCRVFHTLAKHYVSASTRQDDDRIQLDSIDGLDLSLPILPSGLFDNWLAGSQDFLWEWNATEPLIT